MKKNNDSIKFNKTIAALVFDRFYGSGSNAARVLIQRIIVAAAISALGMSYIFSMYTLPVSVVGMTVVSAVAAVVFSALFSVIRKRFAIPFLTIVSGTVIAAAFEPFWTSFSFFVDGIILEFNGRLLDTTASTIHPLKKIELYGAYTIPYIHGVVFGGVILCILFAFITAAGVIGKPHILPSLTAFLLLWVPKLVSERMFFGWQLIPLIALYAGMLAIGSYYRDGLAIRHVYAAGGYRKKVAMDDRRFNATIRSQNVGQKTAARGLHYSKYFSSVMSAGAIFVALGIILSAVFKNSNGIDYDAFYAKLRNLGSGFGSSGDTPFKTGAEADYFASPANSIFKTNNRLKLTSPSTSTREIIRVTKDLFDKPLYLRGDIGIDFDGTSWSSPVTEEPKDWKRNNVYYRWLPAEMIAYGDQTYLNSSNYVTYRMAAYLNVSVEYLCDTDVVFAPAYDRWYTLFDPRFVLNGGDKPIGVDIYGDFTARLLTEKAKGETLEFTAVMPYYTDASDKNDLRFFNMACNVYKSSVVQDSMYYGNIEYLNYTIGVGNRGLALGQYPDYDYNKYKQYVYDTYLGVPEKMKAELDEFIENSGLNEEKRRVKLDYADLYPPFYNETDDLVDRFLSAVAVSDYLKSNYTYSLDARIDKRDPVMSFLNDTKSGHCALYASAMTLILREWGIPARYCTGFAANADLTMVTLRSKDLHAWVEVYLDGLGWVTFDPTAASFFNNQVNSSNPSSSVSNSSGQSSSSSSVPQSSTVSSSSSQSSVSSENSQSSASNSSGGYTHDSSSSSDPGQSFTFAQVLPYILTILAILAVIAVIVLVVIAYIKLRQRANKRVQSFHRSRNSEYVYEKLLAVLRFCKLKPASGEQPHTFFERAEQTLECDICDNYTLLERLAFGNTELDESERALLGRTFDKVYRAAERRYKLIGRIRLRLLVLKRKN